MNIEQCFETLEINSWISVTELKQVYRDLIDVWHPDRFSHNERLSQKAEEKIKRINIAFQTMMDSGQCQVIPKNTKGEKRRYSRNNHELLVDYSTPERRFHSSFDMIKDISGNGIFIETRKTLPIGQKIILSFTLPRFGKLMGITGRVARTCSKGFGVELKITPRYQKLISNFISC